MQIMITNRHGQATTAIQEYARKKADKLPRFYDLVSAIEVILDHQKSQHMVECIVSVEHGEPLVSHSYGTDVYAAIDQCTDRAIRQLSDLKSKLRDNRHHTPTSGADS